MKKVINRRVLIAVLALVLLNACGGKSVQVKDYVKNAIFVNLQATPMLNFYNGQSHPIVIGFYELTEPNAFKQKIADHGFVSSLLEGRAEDSTIVSKFRITMHPDDRKSLRIDKVENARYLAIVAGVYSMGNINEYGRLYSIEVSSIKPNYWSNSEIQRLSIDIKLGKFGFEESVKPKVNQHQVFELTNR